MTGPAPPPAVLAVALCASVLAPEPSGAAPSHALTTGQCERWARELERKATTGLEAGPPPAGCNLDRRGMVRMAGLGALLERRPPTPGRASLAGSGADAWPAIRARTVLIGGIAGLTVGSSLATWMAPHSPRIAAFSSLVGGSISVAGTLWLSARSRESPTLMPTVATCSLLGGLGALYGASAGRWWLDESAGLPFGLGALLGAGAAAWVDERFEPGPSALLMLAGGSLWAGYLAKQWMELATTSDTLRITTVLLVGVGGGGIGVWLAPERGGPMALGGTAGGLLGIVAGGLATDGASFDDPTTESIGIETLLVGLGMAAGAALATRLAPADKPRRPGWAVAPLRDSRGRMAGLALAGGGW